jgi:2-methylisocitrate lyase-like PEP mutase family enzyme
VCNVSTKCDVSDAAIPPLVNMQGLRVCNMMEGNVSPMCTREELKDMGFNIIIHPVSGLYAAAHALKLVYDVLGKKGTTRDDKNMLVDFE